MGMETIAKMIMMNNASLPSVNDFTNGAKGMQQMMNGQLEYAQARDNYEAMKGLRALFAQNPNPDPGQIGAYSPEFAQKYMLNDLSMREKALGIRKTQGEIGNIDSQRLERDAKLWAPMIGALAQDYLDQPNSPEFKAKLGQLIAEGQRQGLAISPDFNIENMTADQLLNIAISRGYESPALKQRYEVDTESQKRALSPPVPPEMAYPTKQWDPQSGQFVRNDPTMPMAPGGRARTAGGGYRVMKPQQSDPTVDVSGVTSISDLKQLYTQYPQGSANRIAIGNRINELQDEGASYENEPDERPSAGITPEQNRALREQQAAAEAKAKADAQSDVARKDKAEDKLSILESIKPVKEIEALIDKSMSSGIEAKIKNVTSGVLGVRDEAYDASKQLKQIEGQLRPIMMGIMGTGAATEKEQQMVTQALGNFADPDASPESRKASLGILLNFARASIQKYPDLNQRLRNLDGKQMTKAVQHTPRAQALIDRHTSGELSDEQFRQEWNAMPDEEY